MSEGLDIVETLRHFDLTDPGGIGWGFFPLVKFAEALEIITDEDGLFVGREKRGTRGPTLGGICWPFDPATDRNVTEWCPIFPVKAIPTKAADPANQPLPGTTTLGGNAAGNTGFGIPTSQSASGDSGGQTFMPAWKRGDAAAGWTIGGDKLGRNSAAGPFGEKFAGDMPGAIMAGTSLQTEERCFVPSGHHLVTPHFGGPAETATWVWDIDSDGKLNKKRKSRLHSALRVTVPVPPVGDPAVPMVAFQIGTARGGYPGGAFADDSDSSHGGAKPAAGSEGAAPQDIGMGSRRLGGPFLPSPGGNCQHLFGANLDGEGFFSLHLSTNTLFARDEDADCPLKFDAADWQKNNDLPGQWCEVFLRRDRDSQHPWVKGARTGLWRWQVQIPIVPVDDDGGGDDGGDGGGDYGGGQGHGGGGHGGGPRKDPLTPPGTTGSPPPVVPPFVPGPVAPGPPGSGWTPPIGPPGYGRIPWTPEVPVRKVTQGPSEPLGPHAYPDPPAALPGGSVSVPTSGLPSTPAPLGGGYLPAPTGGTTSGGPAAPPLTGGSVPIPTTGIPQSPTPLGGGYTGGTVGTPLGTPSTPAGPPPVVRHPWGYNPFSGDPGDPSKGDSVLWGPASPTDGDWIRKNTPSIQALKSVGPSLLAPVAGERNAANGGAKLFHVAMLNELAVPALLLRAQHYNSGVRDFRNAKGWTAAHAHALTRVMPIALRIEALGAEQGASWNYTTGPFTRSRYRGGTTASVISILPPEVGHEAILAGNEPSTISNTQFNFYRSSLTLATPSRSGATNGVQHSRSNVALANGSFAYKVDQLNAAASVVAGGTLLSMGTDAAGLNQAGTNTVVTPSRGTGNASGGEFQVAIGVAGFSSGSTVHGAITRFRVHDQGFVFNTNDGTPYFKLDSTTGGAVGVFGATAVGRQTVTATTDSAGGVASSTFAASGAAYAQAAENNFRSSVALQLNAIRTALVNFGWLG